MYYVGLRRKTAKRKAEQKIGKDVFFSRKTATTRVTVRFQLASFVWRELSSPFFLSRLHELKTYSRSPKWSYPVVVCERRCTKVIGNMHRACMALIFSSNGRANHIIIHHDFVHHFLAYFLVHTFPLCRLFFLLLWHFPNIWKRSCLMSHFLLEVLRLLVAY